MNTGWLDLNGRRFTVSQLRERPQSDTFTGFEKSTLDFCHAWLMGSLEFPLATSGSTGSPKKVVLTRQAMETSARLTIEALHLKSGDHALVCLDPRFIAGQMMLVRSFLADMNIVAIEPSANPLAKLPTETKVDFVAVVPQQLRELIDKESRRLDAIKTVLVGGAAMDQQLKAAAGKFSCKIYSSYGMTETISHIALQKINGDDATDYFQVLPGISIATDSRDCLTIRADYLGNELIVTNDRVELISGDKFRWLGRLDSVINSGGIKIFPEMVEAQCELVQDQKGLSRRFFIAGVADQVLGSRVVMIVEGKAFDAGELDNLRSYLRTKLKKYEVPREIVFVNRFVETATHKIDRMATLRLI